MDGKIVMNGMKPITLYSVLCSAFCLLCIAEAFATNQPMDQHAMYNAQHAQNTAAWNPNPQWNGPAQYSTLSMSPPYSNQYSNPYQTGDIPYRQTAPEPHIEDREMELTGPEDDKILAIAAGLVDMLSSDITDVISGFLNILQAI